MAYAYGGAGKPRPHAPITIGERDFLYDFNGNQVGWDNQKNGSKRRNTWDEDNRLRQVRGPQGITTFAYDQAGQRTVKLGRQGETVYVNQFYVVRNGAIATKHVFAGTGRVASKLQPGTVPSRGGGGRGGGAGGGPPSTPPGQGGGLPPGLEKKDDLPPGQGGVNPGRGRERRSERAKERAQDVYKNPTITGEKPGRGGPAGGAAATEVQGQKSFTGEAPGEFLYFYHPDHLGSTSYVTDDKGAIYEHLQYFPFGETWVQEGQPSNRIPYLFTSKELDAETNLYYFGARYYDPRTSVWLSTDPIINSYLAGVPNNGVYEARNLSLYSFSALNPLRIIDPDGLAFLVNEGTGEISEDKDIEGENVFLVSQSNAEDLEESQLKDTGLTLQQFSTLLAAGPAEDSASTRAQFVTMRERGADLYNEVSVAAMFDALMEPGEFEVISDPNDEFERVRTENVALKNTAELKGFRKTLIDVARGGASPVGKAKFSLKKEVVEGIMRQKDLSPAKAFEDRLKISNVGKVHFEGGSAYAELNPPDRKFRNSPRNKTRPSQAR